MTAPATARAARLELLDAIAGLKAIEGESLGPRHAERLRVIARRLACLAMALDEPRFVQPVESGGAP